MNSSTPQRSMILGAQVMNYGSAEAAWRWPGSDSRTYLNPDTWAETAHVAESGKFHFLFIADHAAVREDLTHQKPSATIDPIVVVSHVIDHTERIGVVLTQSTTFNFPYTVARQLKALDLLSGGRIGWNAVTTNDPTIAANFGVPVADRATRYERAHEFVQLVQALWGSWGPDALKLDTEAGVFADASEIRPIDLGGRHVASRGPLPIPPSPQGQPILFQAGGGAEALAFAARYASGVYSMATDIETGREHRRALQDAATRAGRAPEDVKLFMGAFTTVADSTEEALARREALLRLSATPLSTKVRQLSALVGLDIPASGLREPLPAQDRALLRPAPYQLHSKKAVRLLEEGRSPYEVILRGITDFHTTFLGSPEEIADEMQELFEADACDGFVITPDVVSDGLPAFAEKVVPVLQRRGLFHEDYESATLRGHFGAPHQYGRDIAGAGCGTKWNA
ncbi:NtaA/DmoA family FMN-dependent monooxygenase [Streptomyces gilvus]|uniref:NtaA/DmoA family FMN-dependent monooxygenase n=1 Tax=Streptomyces gilvus TaxID=2920937 RepID=UPI001F105026|nr:NtaA/DmoA family FMN-dependent monooxygenase [Streptomyces sp. CME 23]MCH5677636.1 NtaA/DmoA family FMN-dependent monooxygenase [Streptomyces sp. CME 23]